jgi:hypothetical protein
VAHAAETISVLGVGGRPKQRESRCVYTHTFHERATSQLIRERGRPESRVSRSDLAGDYSVQARVLETNTGGWERRTSREVARGLSYDTCAILGTGTARRGRLIRNEKPQAGSMPAVSTTFDGPVAQLVEQLLCKQTVVGSIPTCVHGLSGVSPRRNQHGLDHP